MFIVQQSNLQNNLFVKTVSTITVKYMTQQWKYI